MYDGIGSSRILTWGQQMIRSSLLLFVAGLLAAAPASARELRDPRLRPIPAIADPSVVLTSHGTARAKAMAVADTFYLLGGPGTHEGKFSNPDGSPMSNAQLLAEGWIFNDVTDQPTLWQRSTFNMANLNANGVGNHGMWAGQTAAQQPGWVSAPGYGNSWDAVLSFSVPMVDPSVAQTVDLDFYFNHDSEPAYDFFFVAYDSAGTYQVLFEIDGTNHDASDAFAAPGLQYAAQSTGDIEFGGNDYPGGEIRLRMHAASDGAWSDADGLWPTVAGLAQVDDITVSYHDGVSPQVVSEDFEGPGPYAWQPDKAPYAGFFGKVFMDFDDLDPCRSNPGPVFAFLDDGTGPFNPDYTGTGTGGSTSPNWTYGVPGGWVLNPNGGISNGLLEIRNYLESPAIPWDLPGTEDDGPAVVGARFRYTVWRHLVLQDGFYYDWGVRARDSVSGIWSGWANRNLGYWGGPDWVNAEHDVTDLLATANGPDAVQVRCGVLDLAQLFAFPGTDATPSPVFDNLAVKKYRIGGPAFALRTIDLFQGGFPQGGETDASTLAARDAMDIRVDMARDVSTGSLMNLPGDSLIVDITAVIPGTSVDPASVKLQFALHKNPYFEDAIRGNLTGWPGASVSAGTGLTGWDVVTGEVAGQVSTTTSGAPVEDRWFFDLPDADFLYPGDLLEYYLEAADTDGRVSTLPMDLSGFGTPVLYDPRFTIRGLPTVTQSGQPTLLVVNDFGHRGGEDELFGALGLPGGDVPQYDLYTVKGPTSLVSNGIGSAGAHGATPAQLAGYDCILYLGGDLSYVLSDGTDTGLNDKGDDLGVLTAWHQQAADRYAAFFGDSIVNGLDSTVPAGPTFLADVLGVDFVDWDVADEIGGLTAPMVQPTGVVPAFAEDFVAYGGCLNLNRFDSIDPRPGAVAAHEFVPGSGGVVRTASVVWDRVESGFRKVDMTFPYGFLYVWNGGAPNVGGTTDRAVLLEEILAVFGSHSVQIPVGVETPATPRLALEPNRPNPFNPRTTLRFALGVEGPVSVVIHDVRGRVVRTLADGAVLPAGPQEMVWDGKDATGAAVASGIYLARVEANGFRESLKMALVR